MWFCRYYNQCTKIGYLQLPIRYGTISHDGVDTRQIDQCDWLETPDADKHRPLMVYYVVWHLVQVCTRMMLKSRALSWSLTVENDKKTYLKDTNNYSAPFSPIVEKCIAIASAQSKDNVLE